MSENKLVITNVPTPDEVEMFNTAVRHTMATSLCKSVSDLDVVEQQLTDLQQKLINKVIPKVETSLESDVMPLDEAITLLDSLVKLKVSLVDTKRKVFNGRELFASSPLSQKDKALLELLNKVNSPQKRKLLEEFINKIEEVDTIEKQEGDDFEELPK